MPALAERLLTPADALRRHLLRALGPAIRPLLRDRELRVAVSFTLLLGSSLLTALLLPLWTLALTPLLFGVPHLLGDLRYLVARPALHRRTALWIAAGVPLLGAAVGLGYRAGFLAVAGAFLCARASWRRRLPGALLCVGLSAVAFLWPYPVDLVLAHLHNLIAVALFWVWRPRVRRLHLLPLGLFALGLGLLLGGALDAPAAAVRDLLPAPAELDLDEQLRWLAPGIDGALGVRLVLAFAFAQSVHYGVWLRLIPEEDRPRPTPRPFASSLRALRADLGAAPLGIALLLAVALIGYACINLYDARAGYFRLALFHGPLELCALALLLAEGRQALRAAR